MNARNELLTTTQLFILCVAFLVGLAGWGITTTTGWKWHTVSCSELASHPGAKACHAPGDD